MKENENKMKINKSISQHQLVNNKAKYEFTERIIALIQQTSNEILCSATSVDIRSPHRQLSVPYFSQTSAVVTITDIQYSH